MTQAARMLKRLSQSAVVASTRLSVAAVLGLAALSLVHQQAVSTVGAATRATPEAAVTVVPTRPAPLAQDAPEGAALQLAARRSRPRPEAPPQETSGPGQPAHKTSAISPAVGSAEDAVREAGPRTGEPASKGESAPRRSASTAQTEPAKPPPTSPPDAKTEAVPEPPQPETWSEAEIITALRDCVRLLAPIAAEVEIAQPVRHEVCGAPAPVLLKRIGSGATKVEVSPPATLKCAMVASLHSWVEKTLQPVARETLGTSVVRLRSASGYVCRARNGHPLGTDRLSEHALANAIDIAGFVTADGRTIDVARSWGPTARDRTAAAQARSSKAEQPKGEATKAEPPRAGPASKKISAIAPRSSEEPPTAKQRQEVRTLRKTAALQGQAKATSDISADPQAAPATDGSERADPKARTEADFLRRLHKGACGVFGTVLGPEANELHRDHFHFDLATRRHSAFCQ